MMKLGAVDQLLNEAHVELDGLRANNPGAKDDKDFIKAKKDLEDIEHRFDEVCNGMDVGETAIANYEPIVNTFREMLETRKILMEVRSGKRETAPSVKGVENVEHQWDLIKQYLNIDITKPDHIQKLQNFKSELEEKYKLAPPKNDSKSNRLSTQPEKPRYNLKSSQNNLRASSKRASISPVLEDMNSRPDKVFKSVEAIVRIASFNYNTVVELHEQLKKIDLDSIPTDNSPDKKAAVSAVSTLKITLNKHENAMKKIPTYNLIKSTITAPLAAMKANNAVMAGLKELGTQESPSTTASRRNSVTEAARPVSGKK